MTGIILVAEGLSIAVMETAEVLVEVYQFGSPALCRPLRRCLFFAGSG